MAQRQEEVKVGALVVVAGLVFLSALVFVGGANVFRKKKVSYTTYFKFAGGLEPGSYVRFGGLKVGTVHAAQIDPRDSTRIRVELQIAGGTPVRTNSKTRISTLGFLGENYVEISPGTRDAPLLPPGSEIPALEIVQLAEVFNNVNNVTTNANKLVNDLDDKILLIADNANQLITNLNAVVGARNRQHLEAALANADAMLAELRPKVNETLANLETATANANTTLTRANTLVGNMNGLVQENRQEIHDVLLRLRGSLADLRQLLADVDDAVANNRENLDETLENIRVSSQNLKQFTDTIKQRPFSLVRVKTEKDRVPAAGK